MKIEQFLTNHQTPFHFETKTLTDFFKKLYYKTINFATFLKFQCTIMNVKSKKQPLMTSSSCKRKNLKFVDKSDHLLPLRQIMNFDDFCQLKRTSLLLESWGAKK